MSEDLLKKKKKPEVSQIPVFSHDEKDIKKAIGIEGLIESITAKMQILVTKQELTSPSRMVEYFYNSFSQIELAFMAMHSLGQGRDKEEAPEEDGLTPFEEVI
jgi:hypothetical protein